MQNEFLSFEEIDAHIEAHFNDDPAATLKSADFAAAQPQLCGVYKAVKPILMTVLRILPERWKRALQSLINILDVLCP